MTLPLSGRAGRVLTSVLVAATSVLLVQSPAMALRDSDKDGLPNKWEKGKTPQGLSLKKLGANPRHKDLFIELAYSTKSGPSKISCTALDKLYNAWKNAPLKNPDAKTGVKLHLDADKKCSSRKYDLGGVSRFKATQPCASPLDSANVLAGKRLNVFHIGSVVAGSELCGPEGMATTTDFLVKDQSGSAFFAYVVMHELGHIFGLDHGPFNGFSVMAGGTYLFGGGGSDTNVDFLRYPVNALDETALDESIGYRSTSAAGNTWLGKWYAPQFCDLQLRFIGPAAGPLDWNCSGKDFWMPPYSQWIDPGTVAYDVNGDGVIGTVPAVPAEWPKIKLNVGRIHP